MNRITNLGERHRLIFSGIGANLGSGRGGGLVLYSELLYEMNFEPFTLIREHLKGANIQQTNSDTALFRMPFFCRFGMGHRFSSQLCVKLIFRVITQAPHEVLHFFRKLCQMLYVNAYGYVTDAYACGLHP